jgi:hypothetical protein
LGPEELIAPDALAIKDCYLFPNADSDIPGTVKLMYELRSKCRDWAGPVAQHAEPNLPLAKSVGQS